MKDPDWSIPMSEFQSVKQPVSAKSWRGIFLAALVILLILSILVISVLFVTPIKLSKTHENIHTEKLLNWSVRYQEVIWISETAFLYANDKELSLITHAPSKGENSHTKRLLLDLTNINNVHIAAVWPCSQGEYILVRYDDLSSLPPDRRPIFEVIHNNAATESFQIRSLRTETGSHESVSSLYCFENGTSLVAVAGWHVYHSSQISPDAQANFGFSCLSCTDQKHHFGQLNPEYKGLFGYKFETPLWTSSVFPHHVVSIITDKTLNTANGAAVFDLTGSGSPVIISNTHLRSAISKESSDEGLFVVNAQILENNHVLFAITPTDQRSLYLIDCSIDTGSPDCVQIWEFTNNVYPLKKFSTGDFRVFKPGIVFTTLPELRGNRLHYRIARLEISQGKLRKLLWCTPKEFDVESLDRVNEDHVWFTSAYLIEGTRHLLRSQLPNHQVTCLSCRFKSDVNQTNLFARLTRVAVSPEGGRYFAFQWQNGYEGFLPLRIQRSAAVVYKNRLTKVITETTTDGEMMKSSETSLIKSVFTCEWANPNPLGTSPVVASFSDRANISQIIWRADGACCCSKDPKNQPTRQRRSPTPMESSSEVEVNEEDFFEPEERLSAKQANMEEEYRRARGKARKLFHHTSLGLSLLTSNCAEEDSNQESLEEEVEVNGESASKRFWMSFSTLRCLRHNQTASEAVMLSCDALVRFWYPPKLNENHITKYAFLLIVKKDLGFTSEDLLLERMAFALSSEHRVVVGRVEKWLGACADLAATEDPLAQLRLYTTLLQTVVQNYHYLDDDKVAVIGKRGPDAHLTGLILASSRSSSVARCGVLITPIVDYVKTVPTLSERYLGSYRSNEPKYILSSLWQNQQNLLEKSLLIMHEFSDPDFPFNETAALSESFVRNRVDHDLMIHPCGAWGSLNKVEEVSFIQKTSTFLMDCFNRTSLRWKTIPRA